MEDAQSSMRDKYAPKIMYMRPRLSTRLFVKTNNDFPNVKLFDGLITFDLNRKFYYYFSGIFSTTGSNYKNNECMRVVLLHVSGKIT